MKGEYVDVQENKPSNGAIMSLIGVVCFVVAIAQAYILFEQYKGTYQISKVQFICTKVEQVGKNLDDVKCVQYTNQKYSKEAIAFNTLR